MMRSISVAAATPLAEATRSRASKPLPSTSWPALVDQSTKQRRRVHELTELDGGTDQERDDRALPQACIGRQRAEPAADHHRPQHIARHVACECTTAAVHLQSECDGAEGEAHCSTAACGVPAPLPVTRSVPMLGRPSAATTTAMRS